MNVIEEIKKSAISSGLGERARHYLLILRIQRNNSSESFSWLRWVCTFKPFCRKWLANKELRFPDKPEFSVDCSLVNSMSFSKLPTLIHSFTFASISLLYTSLYLLLDFPSGSGGVRPYEYV